MFDPLSASDFASTWLAPAVAIVVGTGILAVVSAVVGSRRDKRKAEEDDRKKKADAADADVARERAEKDALVLLLKEQVTEMHVAMLGSPASPWGPATPGIVQKVSRIEGTLFGNGGVNNTVLDRLQRIENGRQPSEEDTDRPDEHAQRKHQ